jgi:transcriptional regulator GlxA family with amidase domain
VRRHVTRWFTVSTSRGTGWYRSQARALSAARWIARESDEAVEVTSEASGATWHVTPPAATPG